MMGKRVDERNERTGISKITRTLRDWRERIRRKRGESEGDSEGEEEDGLPLHEVPPETSSSSALPVKT